MCSNYNPFAFVCLLSTNLQMFIALNNKIEMFPPTFKRFLLHFAPIWSKIVFYFSSVAYMNTHTPSHLSMGTVEQGNKLKLEPISSLTSSSPLTNYFRPEQRNITRLAWKHNWWPNSFRKPEPAQMMRWAVWEHGAGISRKHSSIIMVTYFTPCGSIMLDIGLVNLI